MGSLGMILPVSGGLAYPYIMSIAFFGSLFSKKAEISTKDEQLEIILD
jgi:hypothetical protein